MLLAQFAPSYPVELVLIPPLVLFWAAALVAFPFVVRRWPALAWAGLMIGGLFLVGGILLERVALIWAKGVQPWQLWTWALVTVLPGLFLLGMAWSALRFPPPTAIPTPATLSRLRMFLIGLALMTAWQIGAGFLNLRQWQEDRRQQMQIMQAANRRRGEADQEKREFLRRRLSANGDQRGTSSLRRDVLFFDHGEKSYGFTYNHLISWDLHQGHELTRVQVKVANESFGSGNFAACSLDGSVIAIFMESNKFHRLVLVSTTGEIEREVVRREGEAFRFPDEFVVTGLPDAGRRAWIKRIVTRDGNHSQELQLWNLESGESIIAFPMERDTGFALSQDLSVLAMLVRTYEGQGAYEIRLIDSVTGEVLRRGVVPLPPVKREDRMPVAISLTANQFAYESDGCVMLCDWDDTGKGSCARRPRTEIVGDLQFSPEGERLAVYLKDRAVEIHTLPEGPTTTISVVLSPSNPYLTARLSPDLKLLILPDDRAVLRYSLATGKELLRDEPVE